MNGQQGGDPATPATALLALATSDEPPVRWVAQDLLAQVAATHH